MLLRTHADAPADDRVGERRDALTQRHTFARRHALDPRGRRPMSGACGAAAEHRHDIETGASHAEGPGAQSGLRRPQRPAEPLHAGVMQDKTIAGSLLDCR